MAATLTPTIRLLLRTFLSIYRFFALYISWFIRLVTGNRGTKAEERVLTGKSWDEFCDMLKASRGAPGACKLAPASRTLSSAMMSRCRGCAQSPMALARRECALARTIPTIFMRMRPSMGGSSTC